MTKDLTKIVLNTADLHKDILGAPEEIGPAINYMVKMPYENSLGSVFILDRENVSSVTVNEDKLEVVLREGIEPIMDNDYLFVKTFRPVHITIPMVFGLEKLFNPNRQTGCNGKSVSFYIPYTRREDFCTELKYLESIQRGDTVLYQRK